MARLAIAVCAAISLAATIYIGRHSAALLAVILVAGWVIAPFLALLWAEARSRAASVLVSLACAIVYIVRAVTAPDSSRASVFVAVPAASWIVIAAVVLAARSSSHD